MEGDQMTERRPTDRKRKYRCHECRAECTLHIRIHQGVPSCPLGLDRVHWVRSDSGGSYGAQKVLSTIDEDGIPDDYGEI